MSEGDRAAFMVFWFTMALLFGGLIYAVGLLIIFVLWGFLND